MNESFCQYTFVTLLYNNHIYIENGGIARERHVTE